MSVCFHCGRWSLIAGRLPGRTDNEIKNYWNTNLCKRVQDGVDVGDSKTPSSQEKNNHHDQKAKPQSVTPSVFSSSQPKNNNVIRTKASKCSKVLLRDPLLPCPPMQTQSDDFIAKLLEEAEGEPLLSAVANDFTSGDEDGVLSFDPCGNEKELSTDLLLDLDIGEICLPEFINSDFSYVCDFSYNTHEDLMLFSENTLVQAQKYLGDETNLVNNCFNEEKDNGC